MLGPSPAGGAMCCMLQEAMCACNCRWLWTAQLLDDRDLRVGRAGGGNGMSSSQCSAAVARCSCRKKELRCSQTPA